MNYNYDEYSKLIINIYTLCYNIKQFKKNNKKIVFTNGCFDIFHSGHALMLQKCKELGDILIIGLNSDKSIKSIKGEDRPINSEVERIIVLSALKCVDYIVLFDEDTPYNILNILKPDYLIKGDEYKVEEIIGYDIIIKNKGQVITLPLWNKIKTSEIIKKCQGKQ